MFRFTQKPSSGSSPVLSQNYRMVFLVLVGKDAVNIMAEYQPAVQACDSQWRQPVSTVPALHFGKFKRVQNEILLWHEASEKVFRLRSRNLLQNVLTS
jgi:hypothetical protein